MAGVEEYRFKIDAYTPETMPMARLADYLRDLAIMLGEAKSVHLVRLDPGSTVLVHQIDSEAAPKIELRLAAVRRGDGTPEAMRAYERINRLLGEDKGSGVLANGTGDEIISFQGRSNDGLVYSGISHAGELDGTIVSVGGVGQTVPLRLQTEEELLSGIHASREVAKLLAKHLFEPVRLYGSGWWTRTAAGEWQLERFAVDRFEPLDDRPLADILTMLRAVPGAEWGDDEIDELLEQRRMDALAR